MAAQTGSTSLMLYLYCTVLLFWITASITHWLLLAMLWKVCSCLLYLLNCFPFHHWALFWSLLILTYKIFPLCMRNLSPLTTCKWDTHAHCRCQVPGWKCFLLLTQTVETSAHKYLNLAWFQNETQHVSFGQGLSIINNLAQIVHWKCCRHQHTIKTVTRDATFHFSFSFNNNIHPDFWNGIDFILDKNSFTCWKQLVWSCIFIFLQKAPLFISSVWILI